jgi:hypothetical protein
MSGKDVVLVPAKLGKIVVVTTIDRNILDRSVPSTWSLANGGIGVAGRCSMSRSAPTATKDRQRKKTPFSASPWDLRPTVSDSVGEVPADVGTDGAEFIWNGLDDVAKIDCHEPAHRLTSSSTSATMELRQNSPMLSRGC